MKKILCFLLGHKDPVMDFKNKMSEDEHYELWKHAIRLCKRCDKRMIN